MNSRKIFFIILIFGITLRLSAQGYLVYNNTEVKDKEKETKAKVESTKPSETGYSWKFLSATPSVIDKSMVEKSGEHDFGQRVAWLKSLINKYYVTKEDVIPGDPMMRTIVLKPNVYYTIRKIEKHLKKEVKNGDISTEEASSEMEHILEVALSVIDTEEVGSFEIALRKNKRNTEKLISLFQQVKLQNIYRTSKSL